MPFLVDSGRAPILLLPHAIGFFSKLVEFLLTQTLSIGPSVLGLKVPNQNWWYTFKRLRYCTVWLNPLVQSNRFSKNRPVFGPSSSWVVFSHVLCKALLYWVVDAIHFILAHGRPKDFRLFVIKKAAHSWQYMKLCCLLFFLLRNTRKFSFLNEEPNCKNQIVI